MLGEKPPSIMCDTCGGWHTTEAHSQYEKEAREKRMAEIKARPDSAYRFDTLGFKPENKEKVEPWMQIVIEKAKNLGDDLQDTNFLLHAGQLDVSAKYPSALSFLSQDSLHELPEEVSAYPNYSAVYVWMERHTAGDSLTDSNIATYTFTYTKKKLLQAQEHWLRTQKFEDLAAYQAELQSFLPALGIADLDSPDKRREAMKEIMASGSQHAPEAKVGIIFCESARLLSNFTMKEYSDKSRTFYTRNGEEIVTLDQSTGSVHTMTNQRITDLERAREFYREFIHGLQVTHGSIEEQQEVLKRMLERTKAHPERRLPIYNFYGKLVWPRS